MTPPNNIKSKVDILLLLNYIIYMDEIKVNEQVDFWLESSNKDLTVMNHLFEKKDYSYSLFFGHLLLLRSK